MDRGVEFVYEVWQSDPTAELAIIYMLGRKPGQVLKLSIAKDAPLAEVSTSYLSTMMTDQWSPFGFVLVNPDGGTALLFPWTLLNIFRDNTDIAEANDWFKSLINGLENGEYGEPTYPAPPAVN